MSPLRTKHVSVDISCFLTKFKRNVHSVKFARTVALAVGRGRYICCHCLCVLSMDGYISQGWDTSDTLLFDKAKKKSILSTGFPKFKLFDDLRHF